jgi:hypothetical protein
MGISIDRSLRLRDRGISMWNTLDSQARIYGLSHEVILQETDKIRNAIAIAPHWVKSYVDGYAMALRNAWYHQHLIWCHVAPDGTRYTAHKNRPVWAEDSDPLYKAGRGGEIAVWKHAHFWPNGKAFVEPKAFK